MTQEWRTFTEELLDRILATSCSLHVLGNARGEKRGGKRLIVLHSHHFDAVQQALSSFYTKTTWQRGQASQSSNPVLPRILSTALKFPRREPDHPLPSRAKVKNNENFSICLLVLQRQNFTLLLSTIGIIVFIQYKIFVLCENVANLFF